jgi:spermidine synthase
MISDFSNEWFLDVESEHKIICHRIKEQVVSTKTQFQTVKILDTYQIGRMLILDNKLQSAESDEYVYHECLVHPAMVRADKREKVLILGGGEGAALREVLRYKSVKEVVMVDIDEELVRLCEKYLSVWHKGAFHDKRVRLIFDDAIKFVEHTDEIFDVAIMDITDPLEGGPAALMYTKEFFQAVKRKLGPCSVFVTQAAEVFYNSRSSDPHSVVHKTLASVFPSAESCCAYVPSFSSLWGFVMAYTSDQSSELTSSDIDAALRHNLSSSLKFYDGQTHERIFTLSKAVRDKLAHQTELSTKNNPLTVYPG